MQWQHQFPSAAILLQYKLGICIFFFTSVLKIPVWMKENWISVQPVLQGTIPVERIGLFPNFLVALKALNQATNGGKGICFLSLVLRVASLA